jgi:Tfp pilus assembly ATPase PilU
VEVLLNSPLIADLIFKGEIHGIKEIMKKSKELGMKTFDMASSTSSRRGASATTTRCALPTR